MTSRSKGNATIATTPTIQKIQEHGKHHRNNMCIDTSLSGEEFLIFPRHTMIMNNNHSNKSELSNNIKHKKEQNTTTNLRTWADFGRRLYANIFFLQDARLITSTKSDNKKNDTKTINRHKKNTTGIRIEEIVREWVGLANCSYILFFTACCDHDNSKSGDKNSDKSRGSGCNFFLARNNT